MEDTGKTHFAAITWVLITLVLLSLPAIQEVKGESPVPDWIKNNAGWWSEGIISEIEFLNGIKWLIENGVIIIEASAEPGNIIFNQNNPDQPVLELVTNSTSNEPALVIKNESNENLFKINADGSIQIGSNTVIINPDGTITSGVNPLVVKQSTGQTSNLQEWQSDDGTILASTDIFGRIFAKSFVGSGDYLTSIPVIKTYVNTVTEIIPANGNKFILVWCDTDDFATGGGWNGKQTPSSGYDLSMSITHNSPYTPFANAPDQPAAWQILVVNPTSTDLEGTAKVVCLDNRTPHVP